MGGTTNARSRRTTNDYGTRGFGSEILASHLGKRKRSPSELIFLRSFFIYVGCPFSRCACTSVDLCVWIFSYLQACSHFLYVAKCNRGNRFGGSVVGVGRRHHVFGRGCLLLLAGRWQLVLPSQRRHTLHLSYDSFQVVHGGHGVRFSLSMKH